MIALLALLLLCIGVTVYDLRHKRILNWVTMPLFIFGLIANSPHSFSLYIVLLAFWLTWLFGWMGAGDAKLWMGLLVALPSAYQRLWVIPLVFLGTGAFQLLWRKSRGNQLTGIRTPGAWRSIFYILAILIQEFQHAYGPISCPIG